MNKKSSAKTKSRSALHKSTAALSKSGAAKNKNTMVPQPFYRPEYLGKVFTLGRSSSIPSYMPTNENDLMVWAKGYVDTALKLLDVFPTVFGLSAPMPLTGANGITDLWRRANDAILNLQSLTDWMRSWRSYRISCFM